MKKGIKIGAWIVLLLIIFYTSFDLGKNYGKKHIVVVHTTKEQKGVYTWMLAKSEMPEATIQTVYDTALKYDNADLILAIIKTESNFNPFAKSHGNAIGLMGIIPSWWSKELIEQKIIKSKRDLYDIEKNIRAGNYILTKYFGTYKNIDLTLEKYSGNAKGYSHKVFVALGEINYARMKGTW